MGVSGSETESEMIEGEHGLCSPRSVVRSQSVYATATFSSDPACETDKCPRLSGSCFPVVFGMTFSYHCNHAEARNQEDNFPARRSFS